MSAKFRDKRIFVPRFADAANNNAQARNAQSIMARWQSEGYRLSTICAGEPEGRILANPRVDIRRLPDNRYWPAAFFLAYFGSYDCIFYPGTHHYTDWLALKARALLGRRVPVIATMEALVVVQGDVQAERSISELAGHQVYAYHVPSPQARRYEDILTMADHIVAISPLLAKVAASRYGAEKVSMLPLGVDTELFSNTTPSLRERPRVVGVGQVRAHKRPEMFLSLARHFPQADFVWFGEGDMLAEVRRQIERHDCQNVVFPGAVSARALAGELAASDVFVLPSLSEGVPKVTQEAAASGLAQIIFGFYQAPTVIEGCNGYVVWSDQELIARLGQLLENRQLIAEMGKAGAQMAQSWSWDVVAVRWERQIIEVMERIAARTGRHDHIAPAAPTTAKSASKNAQGGACALDQLSPAPQRDGAQSWSWDAIAPRWEQQIIDIMEKRSVRSTAN